MIRQCDDLLGELFWTNIVALELAAQPAIDTNGDGIDEETIRGAVGLHLLTSSRRVGGRGTLPDCRR